MRDSTATGRPLEVIIRSPLPADFNHWLAGLFFSSVTEIVLTVATYKEATVHASPGACVADERIAPKVLLPRRGVKERLKDTLCQKSGYRGRNG